MYEDYFNSIYEYVIYECGNQSEKAHRCLYEFQEKARVGNITTNDYDLLGDAVMAALRDSKIKQSHYDFKWDTSYTPMGSPAMYSQGMRNKLIEDKRKMWLILNGITI